MRIACVGWGPAGLYFSILMKLWDPANDVVVFERGKEGVTHGWGVTMLHARQAPLLGKLPPRLPDIRRRAGLAGEPRSLAG